MVDKYQAWLVDLDGTLYPAKPLKLCMGLELVLGHVHLLPLLRAFRHEHERLRQEDSWKADNPFALQIQRTAQKLNRSAEQVEAVVREWMIARPGKWLRRFKRASLIQEIATFHQSGGKTAVVSDYPSQEKLQAMGLTEHFDVIIANGEPDGPSRLKPDPAGYLKAASKLDTDPKACLVIGDRSDADGEAARRAGMAFRHVR